MAFGFSKAACFMSLNTLQKSCYDCSHADVGLLFSSIHEGRKTKHCSGTHHLEVSC